MPQTPNAYLQFRIVMAAVPSDDLPVKAMLQRMAALLEVQVQAPTERRIVSLTADELMKAPVTAPQELAET